jgi:CheY-like chemotaxis protein
LHNGKNVLPAVQSFRPDVVILDVAIPGMSGYAVAQAIRHSYTEAARPLLVAISGMWTERPDRMIAQQVGFDHHLLKPAHPKDLLELLRPIRGPSP